MEGLTASVPLSQIKVALVVHHRAACGSTVSRVPVILPMGAKRASAITPRKYSQFGLSSRFYDSAA